MAARNPVNLNSLCGEATPAKFVAIADVNCADAFISTKQRHPTRITTRYISRHGIPVDILGSLQIFRDADTGRPAQTIDRSYPKAGEVVPKTRYSLVKLVL